VNAFEFCDGISAIADRHDAFLIDAWGVLHDGTAAYPGAVECLQQLRSHGKQIIILSNAARRSNDVAAEMQPLGITPAHFDHVVSSGELAWQALKAKDDAFHSALGRKCFYLGPRRSQGLLDGLDLIQVDDVKQASFILNAGAQGDSDSTESHQALLESAAAQGLPMVCANPDLAAIRAGIRGISAGALAKRYEEVGGRVRYHGKPHADIYQACFDWLNGPPKERVLAIGDAVRTDIAGAVASGIHSAFVVCGIHLDRLGSPAPTSAQLSQLFKEQGCWPNLVIPMLSW